MEYDRTFKIKGRSKRVKEQLTGLLCYICKYTEKHDIPVPERELAYNPLAKCENMFYDMFKSVRKSPAESQ